MTEARQAALIAELVRKLRSHGSWAGETHVQKTAYFLQEMLGVPLGMRFQLYKYGPFSFELRDLLTQMRGLDQIRLERQPFPYGPKLSVAEGADQLKTRFPKTLQKYDDALEFAAEQVGPLGVGDLERLATGLMVTLELPDGDVDERASALHRYKPHVGLAEARAAVETVEELSEVSRAIATPA